MGYVYYARSIDSLRINRGVTKTTTSFICMTIQVHTVYYKSYFKNQNFILGQ